MQVGHIVFFDKTTGGVLVVTPEISETSANITAEGYIAIYKVLSERNRDTFDFIELEYGQYAQDFAESNGYRVNPETKQIEFSYPDPNETEPSEPVFQVPLSEKVELLEQEKAILQLALAETIEKQELDKISNQLALADLVETLIIKGVL